MSALLLNCACLSIATQPAVAHNAGDARTNSVGMKLVYVPAGEFEMGLEVSPEKAVEQSGGAPDWYANQLPHHRVRLTKPFWLGARHVTRGEFARFVREIDYRTDAERQGNARTWNGTKFTKTEEASWRRPGFEQTDEHPVVCVSHDDAVAFCRWLSAKESQRYRLPSEAEFEYAYRAGSQGAFVWGDRADDGQGWANCADRTARETFAGWTTFDWSDGHLYTAPAGSFRANAWGLHDMAGNAWQWTSDRFGAYSAGDVVDPTGPKTGTHRVLRGGSWYGAPCSVRASYRSKIDPDYRGSNVGFRVVADAAND